MTIGNRKLVDQLTMGRAVTLSVIVAVVVYVGAIGHGWTFDDTPIIGQNVNVRSIGTALGAFFRPYWPVELGAGQYRPLAILSFGVDWSLTYANSVFTHVVNMLLHGLATGLFVLVLRRWLPPLGALVAGLVFAVHPVHVEAVAGGVGRSELLAACFLFGAILVARRYRTATGRVRSGWLAVTLVLALCGMLSKEHGVVAIALLAADEWLEPNRRFRQSVPLYLGMAVVTLSWIFVFERIAARYVGVSTAATLRDLTAWERLATAFPVQLHVLRLLAWPFDLSADYNPQVIPRLTEWTWVSGLGLAAVVAVLLLSVVVMRRYPVLTFGIWVAICTYSPTSNLLFASGIILAERNLYMAAGALAVVLGWAVNTSAVRDQGRLAVLAVFVVLGGLTVRTVTRVPAWADTATLVIEDYFNHPENYRTRIRLSTLLRDSDRLPEAVAEVTAAGAIFPVDPFIVTSSVPLALAVGDEELGWREAERGHALDPENPGLSRLTARARLATGRIDSSIAVARRSVERWPRDTTAALTYQETVDSLSAPGWVRAFAHARVHWTQHRLATATDELLTGVDSLPEAVGPTACWDLRTVRPLFDLLRPAAMGRLDAVERAEACASGPG